MEALTAVPHTFPGLCVPRGPEGTLHTSDPGQALWRSCWLRLQGSERPAWDTALRPSICCLTMSAYLCVFLLSSGYHYWSIICPPIFHVFQSVIFLAIMWLFSCTLAIICIYLSVYWSAFDLSLISTCIIYIYHPFILCIHLFSIITHTQLWLVFLHPCFICRSPRYQSIIYPCTNPSSIHVCLSSMYQSIICSPSFFLSTHPHMCVCHLCIYLCLHPSVYLSMYLYSCKCIYVFISVHLCIHLYILYLSTYPCIHLCMYLCLHPPSSPSSIYTGIYHLSIHLSSAYLFVYIICHLLII